MPSPKDPSVSPHSLPKGPENLHLHKNLHACTWISTAGFLITAKIWKQPRCASLVAQLAKNPPAILGDLGSIPGLGRSPGEGKGYPLQYSGLESSMDSPWGQKESDRTEKLSLQISSVGKWVNYGTSRQYYSAPKSHERT